MTRDEECPQPEVGMCGLPDPESNVPCWAAEGHDGPHWPWDTVPVEAWTGGA